MARTKVPKELVRVNGRRLKVDASDLVLPVTKKPKLTVTRKQKELVRIIKKGVKR